jgi:hypothetical protein
MFIPVRTPEIKRPVAVGIIGCSKTDIAIKPGLLKTIGSKGFKRVAAVIPVLEK